MRFQCVRNDDSQRFEVFVEGLFSQLDKNALFYTFPLLNRVRSLKGRITQGLCEKHGYGLINIKQS